MKLVPIIVFLICLGACTGQPEKNKVDEKCEKLLKTPVTNDSKAIATDLYALLNCTAIIDSFDLIYMGPFISQALMKHREQKSSYEQLLEGLKEVKKTASYSSRKAKSYPDYLLKKKVAKIESWEEDEQLFVELGVPTDFLEGYKSYLKENADGIKTHRQLTKAYQELIRKK